jgi:hypothetical protein
MEIDEIRARAWRYALQAEALRERHADRGETYEAAASSLAFSLLLIEQQLDQIRIHLEKSQSGSR